MKRKVLIIFTVIVLLLHSSVIKANSKMDSLDFMVADPTLTTQLTGTYNASADKFRNLTIDIYSISDNKKELIKEINSSNKYNIGGKAPINILIDLPIGKYRAFYNKELKIESVNFVDESKKLIEQESQNIVSNSESNEVYDPLAKLIQKQLILDEFISERQTFNLKFTTDNIFLNKQELPKKYHQKYLNIINDFKRKPTEKEPIDIWVIY